MKKTLHHPVLLYQVIQVLAPKSGETYLDGTAGFGSHAAAVLDKIGPRGRLILVDRDAHATQALDERFGDTAEIIHADFPVSYTHLRAHETRHDLVCRLLLEKKKKKK